MKKRLIRIGISIILFCAALLIGRTGNYPVLYIFLAAWFIAGYDVVIGAVRNIIRGQVFDENLLMSIASIGAFLIGEAAEGAAVMAFYQVGELFQEQAVGKARRSIAELMDIRPEYANILRDGRLIQVDPSTIVRGDHIIIKAGEKVPLDARIIEGSSMVDTAALTGESVPREVTVDDEILSGFINMNGLLEAEVINSFGESAVSRILELVENAASRKAKTENFITRFARVYTPAVVAAAALLAVVPPLILKDNSFSDWVYRALTFLVVSCPCALVISVPLGFFGGIGGASRRGILFKGSNCLETLARVDTVVFDKTGTLTCGEFEVSEVDPVGVTKEELLMLAASAESFSTHPISSSLRRAYGHEIQAVVSNIQELPGRGVRAEVSGKTVLAGNARLMAEAGIGITSAPDAGTAVYVASDGVFAGHILISDRLKKDSKKAVSELRRRGISRLFMLTGDSKAVGEKVGKELGLDKVYAELLPDKKVEMLEMLLDQNPSGTLAYAGDGINDAPVLARADVGIAMGGLGSDAAIEAADIVIMTDEPLKIADAIGISRRTLSIIRENIVFALSVKGIVLLMSALGFASMWAAVFADVGVTVIAILNSVRALRAN